MSEQTDAEKEKVLRLAEKATDDLKKRISQKTINFFKNNSNLVKKLEVRFHSFLNETGNLDLQMESAIRLCSVGIAAYVKEMNEINMWGNKAEKEALKNLGSSMDRYKMNYRTLVDLHTNYRVEVANCGVTFGFTDFNMVKTQPFYGKTLSKYNKLLPYINEILQITFGKTALMRGLTQTDDETSDDTGFGSDYNP